MEIEYRFDLNNGESHSFRIDLERVYTQERDAAQSSPWTALGFHRCAHCPLSPDKYRHCPAAVDVKDIVERFAAIKSIERAVVRVTTPQRVYLRECDVQTGLDAVIGLVMATSGCPILRRLRPMAQTHLPFSTPYEATMRTVGHYLIQQYYASLKGQKADWKLEGLKALYDDLSTVNTHFSDRVRAASSKDANVNALIQLFSLAVTVSASLEERLAEYEGEFSGD